MKKLFLISSSKAHGGAYFAHCLDDLKKFIAPERKILFIPYADFDEQAYEKEVSKYLGASGFEVTGISIFSNPIHALSEFPVLLVGGGNTFLLLDKLYKHNLLSSIRERVLSGKMVYVGSSAGTVLACPTIQTTNTMAIVYPPSFNALALIPFQINPHYEEWNCPVPHIGETKKERIEEFLQENSTPVLALPEDSYLIVSGSHGVLKNGLGARLFTQEKVISMFKEDDIGSML